MSQQQQYAFGAGGAWAVLDASNPTPTRFGAVQGANVKFTGALKSLHGQYQYALATGRGATTVGGDITFAQLGARMLNDLIFGGTLATGQVRVADKESGTIATNAVTVTNSATFATDLGVRAGSTGLPMVRVASSPAAGQYSVSAGVYSFNASETETSVIIDYTYTVSGSGQKVTIGNPLMGAVSAFAATLTQQFKGLYHTLQLNACTAGSLDFATQMEDFTKPKIDFQANVDSSDVLGVWSFAKAT